MAAPSITFDPCQPTNVAATGASAEELASIDDAIAMWRGLGVNVSRAEPAQIAIAFRPSAQALYGFYDDAAATIYINRKLADDAQRSVTLAHELGHAFALEHVDSDVRASVMNPGNVTRAPDAGDRAQLALAWSHCAALSTAHP